MLINIETLKVKLAEVRREVAAGGLKSIPDKLTPEVRDNLAQLLNSKEETDKKLAANLINLLVIQAEINLSNVLNAEANIKKEQYNLAERFYAAQKNNVQLAEIKREYSAYLEGLSQYQSQIQKTCEQLRKALTTLPAKREPGAAAKGTSFHTMQLVVDTLSDKLSILPSDLEKAQQAAANLNNELVTRFKHAADAFNQKLMEAQSQVRDVLQAPSLQAVKARRAAKIESLGLSKLNGARVDVADFVSRSNELRAKLKEEKREADVTESMLDLEQPKDLPEDVFAVLTEVKRIARTWIATANDRINDFGFYERQKIKSAIKKLQDAIDFKYARTEQASSGAIGIIKNEMEGLARALGKKHGYSQYEYKTEKRSYHKAADHMAESYESASTAYRHDLAYAKVEQLFNALVRVLPEKTTQQVQDDLFAAIYKYYLQDPYFSAFSMRQRIPNSGLIADIANGYVPNAQLDEVMDAINKLRYEQAILNGLVVFAKKHIQPQPSALEIEQTLQPLLLNWLAKQKKDLDKGADSKAIVERFQLAYQARFGGDTPRTLAEFNGWLTHREAQAQRTLNSGVFTMSEEDRPKKFHVAMGSKFSAQELMDLKNDQAFQAEYNITDADIRPVKLNEIEGQSEEVSDPSNAHAFDIRFTSGDQVAAGTLYTKNGPHAKGDLVLKRVDSFSIAAMMGALARSGNFDTVSIEDLTDIKRKATSSFTYNGASYLGPGGEDDGFTPREIGYIFAVLNNLQVDIPPARVRKMDALIEQIKVAPHEQLHFDADVESREMPSTSSSLGLS